jgi:hypothetical protein
MPTWTDTGGFILALISLGLAVALAIVGWVQVHDAKQDAKTAKDQADAARRIADEAQRQTAAAEAAAIAAKDQAEAAVAALEWETIPQLEVVASKTYTTFGFQGSVRTTVSTSDWIVRNNGKAAAIRLTVELDFGTDSVIAIGPNSYTKLDADQSEKLGLFGVTMPPFEDLVKEGHTPMATLHYGTPTGEVKKESRPVLPSSRS